MNHLLQENYKYISQKDILGVNTRILKSIVSSLNKKSIIMITWMTWVNKLWAIKEMIIKTKMQKDFFYFNSELDIKHEIQSDTDLDNIYNNKKLIILENIITINNVSNFIHSSLKKWKKVLLIGNNTKLKWVSTIEVLPHFKEDLWTEYYNLLTQTILSKDIYIDNKLKSFEILKTTLYILAWNTQLISVRQIHTLLLSYWLKISHITLIEYINALLHSNLIKKLLRYDIKTNKDSTGKAKYFFTETQTRISAFPLQIKSHIINKNSVFQKLEYLWYSLFTGKNGTFEFDFISKWTGQNIIVHMSSHTQKNEVKKEVKKLLKIPWKYQKYLILSSIKEVWIRPSTHYPLQIMDIDNFLTLTSL